MGDGSSGLSVGAHRNARATRTTRCSDVLSSARSRPSRQKRTSESRTRPHHRIPRKTGRPRAYDQSSAQETVKTTLGVWVGLAVVALGGLPELDAVPVGSVTHPKQALVVVAVEVRGAGSGRIRLQVIDDASGDTLCDFVTTSIAAGTTVHTDGWSGYKRLRRLGFDHQPRSRRAHDLLGGDPDEILPRVHRVISHLKTWLQGTHRGVSEEHLQAYLDEFTFRFNRRRTPMAAFRRVLGLGSQLEPTTDQEIFAEGPSAARRAAESNG